MFLTNKYSGMTSQPSFGALVASLQNTPHDTGKFLLLYGQYWFVHCCFQIQLLLICQFQVSNWRMSASTLTIGSKLETSTLRLSAVPR